MFDYQSEKLCRSLDDKQLQSKCYDYIEVASKMGKEAPKYCSRPQICPSESTERIEVSESETIIRKTKTGGATDEYYRRSLTLDNGKVALESVAVNTESSRSSPQTGRRQITRSTHSADDVLEVRDDKPHESHRAGHCVDNDCDDNDDYDDDDDDDKIARPSLTLRWAQFIVFYGSLYLPWICIALLILGVFIELYDISGYFDDDYKNLPADATTDKVGYYCIVRETDDAAAKSSKKNSI